MELPGPDGFRAGPLPIKIEERFTHELEKADSAIMRGQRRRVVGLPSLCPWMDPRQVVKANKQPPRPCGFELTLTFDNLIFGLLFLIS